VKRFTGKVEGKDAYRNTPNKNGYTTKAKEANT